ncbi:MAG: ABC transporter substrate-binding protein [Actinomycetota bacterium]
MPTVKFFSRSRNRSAFLALPLFFVACGNADLPELVSMPTATEKPQIIEEETEKFVSNSDVAENPTEEIIEEVENISEINRGISDEQVSIVVLKSGNVFKDVEIGVQALLERVNKDGGAASRKIEILEVIDDNGEEELTLSAVQRIAEENVFAVILASVGASSEVTDFLAEKQIPFFGWGFVEGFCEPNKWGFGFNGCVNAVASGLASGIPDTSSLRLTQIFYGRTPEVILVTTNDAAGAAFVAHMQSVWDTNIVKVLEYDKDVLTSEEILDGINGIDADVLWLSVGLDKTIEIKKSLVSGFPGMVVDDVTYLPGILQSYDVASQLEGGYVFTQFPPQEEYRSATTRIMTDLKSIDGPLIYSQAISVGYWSADLLVSILNSVGEDFNLRTFFRTANVEGALYNSDFAGGPCPFQTVLSHQDPAGGAALLQVRGGVFRPVVNFNCPLKD